MLDFQALFGSYRRKQLQKLNSAQNSRVCGLLGYILWALFCVSAMFSARALSNTEKIKIVEELAHQHLSAEDKTKVVERILPDIKDPQTGRFILNQAHQYLSEEDKVKIWRAMAYSTKSASELKGLSNESSVYFSDKPALERAYEEAQRLLCLKNELKGAGK